MSLSDSQKKSRNKWDQKNMTTLGCKVKKEEAEIFKKYAESKNMTANGMLKIYVTECIRKFYAEHENKK